MSTVQWITPRRPLDYVAMSADGYYRVAKEQNRGFFDAYHVPALWARPEKIGEAATLTLAQQICDDHRDKLAAEFSNPS